MFNKLTQAEQIDRELAQQNYAIFDEVQLANLLVKHHLNVSLRRRLMVCRRVVTYLTLIMGTASNLIEAWSNQESRISKPFFSDLNFVGPGLHETTATVKAARVKSIHGQTPAAAGTLSVALGGQRWGWCCFFCNLSLITAAEM